MHLLRGRRGLALGLTVVAAIVGQSAVVAFPAAAQGTVISDGGFERPALISGSCTDQTYEAGQQAGAWSVSNGTATLANCNQYETAYSGAQLMLLGDGNKFDPPTQICQDATGLVPGASYKIHLFVASGGADSVIEVSWGGSAIADVRAPAGGTTLAWRGHSLTAIADATTDTFCLQGFPDGRTLEMAYPAVDDVRITPIA